MAGRRLRRESREYRFQIDAFTPETMPMGRLAEYLHDLAVLFGEDKSVHLLRIEKGSTVPVILVEWEAEPKVRDRLRAVRRKEAPPEEMNAAAAINRRLEKDNAKAAIVDPVGTNLVRFPGREVATLLEYGPFSQPGTLVGVPIRIGGESDPVPLHLEDGKDKHICSVKRALAKQIAAYLFTSPVCVEGTSRWMRHSDGEWERISFQVTGFRPLESASLRGSVDQLRAVKADWKELADPLEELRRLRHG